MTGTWIVVTAVGLATFALKAAGPVLLGGRPLPQRLASVVSLLAPSVLAALVVTQAIADGREIVIDERLLGVAVAGVAIGGAALVAETAYRHLGHATTRDHLVVGSGDLTRVRTVLEHDGIIEKHAAARRAEYELTEKGTALLPIIDEMSRFGHAWLVDDETHTHAHGGKRAVPAV